MQIEQRGAGDVTIVTINGDITLNKGGDVLLKDKIHSLLQQGTQEDPARSRRRVLCGQRRPAVSWCRCARRSATTAARLKMVNVTKRLKDLLVVTKLVTVFDSYDSEAEALASFGGAAKA